MISASNVSKYYDGRRVLHDITVTVEKGKSLGVVGPNGAGKSTLIQILLSLIKPSEGKVEYSFKKEKLPWAVGVQLQNGYFEGLLKVNEICRLFCNVYSLPYSVAEALLETFNLSYCAKTKTAGLSGGERQKLNILLSILHKPEILFFDELTTGLDALSRAALFDILQKQKTENKTIVLVSHYFEEIWNVCDEVLVLVGGNQVFLGPVNDLGSSETGFKKSITSLISNSMNNPGATSIL